MIIGIDHGNAQIKTRNTCFVSGVEEFPTKPPMAADVIQYQSRYWTLVGKRLPVMRDKTKDDRFYLLTLFAISKELEARKEITSTLDIDLAVGLPPEHYGMLKDSFAQYFRRQETVRFTYNDKPFSLMLDHVFVYPQAFGAVVQRAQEMTATSRTFVIDIGGYTSDVLLLRKGKPDMEFCRSLNMGVITMTNHIAGKVNSLYDISIDDEHICEILAGQNTVLDGEIQTLFAKRSINMPLICSTSSVNFRWTCGQTPPYSWAAGRSCCAPLSRRHPLSVLWSLSLTPEPTHTDMSCSHRRSLRSWPEGRAA